MRIVKQYERVCCPAWAAAGVRGPALRLILPDGDVLPRVSPGVVTTMPIHEQGILTRDNVSVDVTTVEWGVEVTLLELKTSSCRRA